MTPSTWRTAALLPTAVAALLLSACGSTVAGGSGSGSDLPVLRIGARTAVDAAADAGPSAPDDPYPLAGTLPTGPDAAPVHRYGTTAVPDATVTGLAAALGLSGSAVRHAHGVVVESRAGALRVRDGGAWSFTRTGDLCPGVQVDVDHADLQGMAVSCASEGPGAPGTPPPPSDARTTASRLLAAVGDAALPAQVQTHGSTVIVTVDEKVGGARTTAVSTSVTVDATGVASAYGVVGTPTEGPAYPLISAAQALDALRAMPRPAMEIYCPKGSACPAAGPQRITGAELGLVSAYDGDEQILVPAWFFSVEGSTDPLTVVAVADRYLADPEPVGGTGSGGGSVGGSSGSPVPPGEPASPQPAPPAPTASDLPLPVAPGYRVTSYSVSTDGRTLTLRTEGGVCTDYAGGAQQSRSQVAVTITGTPNASSGQVCPAIAKVVEVDVALDAPLAGRPVVDARTGDAVPRA